MRGALDEAARWGVTLDSGTLAAALFDDEQCGNMLLVRAAPQIVALPLHTTAVERAITLNGVAVTENIQLSVKAAAVEVYRQRAGKLIAVLRRVASPLARPETSHRSALSHRRPPFEQQTRRIPERTAAERPSTHRARCAASAPPTPAKAIVDAIGSTSPESSGP